MAFGRHTAGTIDTTSARCCQGDWDKEASMVQDQDAPAMPPRPDPALKRLERFVGTWDMKGRTLGSDMDNVSGRTTFEWLAGGFFLQQRATLDFTGLHIESLELIGYEPETNTFPSTVFSNLAPTPLPYRWEVGEDTLRITVSYGPLDATFTGRWSQDGESFGGGWRPNPGADETVNAPYDIQGRRAT
jgi:Protein of unknown function (DUF1579)